jgi:hypothetical protein
MTRRSRIVAPVVAAVVAAGVTTAVANAVLATPSGAAGAGGTALNIGQTVDLATNVTVTPGATVRVGPVNTKLCPRVEEFLDVPDSSYGQIRTGMVVMDLPGQDGSPILLPDTQSNGATQTENSEPAPLTAVQLFNETASDQTALNVYVYCAPAP